MTIRRRRCATCRKLSLGGDSFGGHDHCIANLPGVQYACCGHGSNIRAYVVFDDGLALYGNAALAAMEMIGGNPPAPRRPHLEWIVDHIHPAREPA